MDKLNTYCLPNISNEQQNIIDCLKSNNVIVDSVAGSGKTTTNMYIAKQFNTKNILLLTYNKKLKIETREKISKLGITNIEVHSYHSFCVKYYNHKCYDDQKIKQIISQYVKPMKLFSYDIIILDEAQDIAPLYYNLICKIYYDNNKDTKICILGDKYQSIYDFNNADSRFITLANELFNYNNDKWLNANLSHSFRVTSQIAMFVNKCLLNNDRIKANKHGEKVRYVICDVFGDKIGTSNRPYEEVKHYINSGYKYDEIFILAPSVRNERSPIRQLANKLSEKGIPLYVPNSDEEKIDEDILMNKMVFSTFHQAKGLERKVIIVYNFDDSYFKYYKKDSEQSVCPNEIYVACTRALERITLLHHYENDYLPFINKGNLRYCCSIEKQCELKITRQNKNKLDVSVTDLCKHLSMDVVEHALTYIDVKEISMKDDFIDIQIKTKQGELYESVSEITGISIPAYYELVTTGKMTIFKDNVINNVVNNQSEYLFTNDNQTLDEIVEDEMDNIDLKNINTKQLLYVANIWNMYKTGYTYKVNQIKDYDWLSKDNLDKCVKRLEQNLSNKSIFEKKYVTEDFIELQNRKLTGHIDCIDGNNIWELKCVQQLDNTHKLQLAIYMYQYLMDMDDEDKSEICIIEQQLKHKIVNELDVVEFLLNGEKHIGLITKKFKNEKMNIKTSKKTYKVTNDDILRNVTLEEKLQLYQPHFYLFNILDNNILEITSDISRLRGLIGYLIKIKYNSKTILSDEQFINKMNNIKENYSVIEDKDATDSD